jgi:hypothetical protein
MSAVEAWLREVAESGVAFEDERVRYVEVQIDRRTWLDIQAWASHTDGMDTATTEQED